MLKIELNDVELNPKTWQYWQVLFRVISQTVQYRSPEIFFIILISSILLVCAMTRN